MTAATRCGPRSRSCASPAERCATRPDAAGCASWRATRWCPGAAGGEIGPEQLSWLDRALVAEPGVPTIVAMHHPPISTGMPFLDEMGLAAADRDGLRDLLARHPHVRRVVCGHVHLAATALLGTCPVVTCPSTWRVCARLRLAQEGYELEDGPAGLALHGVIDGDVVSHVQTFEPPAPG